MGTRPVIGLTLDAEAAGGYAKYPWYAIRENYCTAVLRAGGLPVLLPHEPGEASAYVDTLAGLVITGGGFDIDPAHFGASTRHATVKTKDRRTAFELAATEAALSRHLPVLGICGGAQLLNVVFGGTLIQHIPDEVPNALAHEQPNPRDQPGHDVALAPESLLHRICGAPALAVNSAHHQAAKEVGAGVSVVAHAPDGVIEAIEVPAQRFCIGVQWHPEFAISPSDEAIFSALMAAAGAP